MLHLDCATVNRRCGQRMQSTTNPQLFKDVISIDSFSIGPRLNEVTSNQLTGYVPVTNSEYRNTRNSANVRSGAVRKTNANNVVSGSNTNVSVASSAVSTTTVKDRDQARNTVEERIARRNDRMQTASNVEKSETEILREQLDQMQLELKKLKPKADMKQKRDESPIIRSSVNYPHVYMNNPPASGVTYAIPKGIHAERTQTMIGQMHGLGIPFSAASTPKNKNANKSAANALSARENNERILRQHQAMSETDDSASAHSSAMFQTFKEMSDGWTREIRECSSKSTGCY